MLSSQENDAFGFRQLEKAFLHRARIGAAYARAQTRLSDAFASQLRGQSTGPSDEAFDDLAVLMSASQNADVRYLHLLGKTADRVIACAQRGPYTSAVRSQPPSS